MGKSSSTRRAGQVLEQKDRHSDSMTGVEGMSRQRKIGERARKITRGRNQSGKEVQDDVCNFDDSKAPEFEQEWEQAASKAGLNRHPGSTGRLGFQPKVNIRPQQRRTPAVHGAQQSLPGHMSQDS